MKPNFKDINIKASEKAPMSAEAWEKANHIAKNWTTPELIPVKPVYSADDLKGMEHLDYVAGIPPYLRGPYSAMYPLRPWTIRQYAGFAPEAFEKLKDKAIIVVAGNPESRPELEAKGLMNYIHVKNNVLEELKGYQQKLGI